MVQLIEREDDSEKLPKGFVVREQQTDRGTGVDNQRKRLKGRKSKELLPYEVLTLIKFLRRETIVITENH